jgi:hypothetical protein
VNHQPGWFKDRYEIFVLVDNLDGLFEGFYDEILATSHQIPFLGSYRTLVGRNFLFQRILLRFYTNRRETEAIIIEWIPQLPTPAKNASKST